MQNQNKTQALDIRLWTPFNHAKKFPQLLWAYERIAIELTEAIEAKRDEINVERADPVEVCDRGWYREKVDGFVYKVLRNPENRLGGSRYISAEKVSIVLQRELYKRRDGKKSILGDFDLYIRVQEKKFEPHYKILIRRGLYG